MNPLLTLVLLGACTTTPVATPDAGPVTADAAAPVIGPSIALLLVSTPPSQSPPDKPTALTINNAQHAWEAFGIRVTDRVVPLAECPTPWFDHTYMLPCAVTIHLTLVATSAELGGVPSTTDLSSSSSTVALDAQGLQSVLSREIGAHMFATTDHLPAGTCGIMSTIPGVTEPTPADVTFAVAHTHGWVAITSDSYTTTCQ